MPQQFAYKPHQGTFPPEDRALLRSKLRALYFANTPHILSPGHPNYQPLATVYLQDDTTANVWAFNFQGRPAAPYLQDDTKDNQYWMDVDTSGATAYNYLEMNSPWVMYISNGEIIFHNVAPGGTSIEVPTNVTFVWNVSTDQPDYTPPTT